VAVVGKTWMELRLFSIGQKDRQVGSPILFASDQAYPKDSKASAVYSSGWVGFGSTFRTVGAGLEDVGMGSRIGRLQSRTVHAENSGTRKARSFANWSERRFETRGEAQ